MHARHPVVLILVVLSTVYLADLFVGRLLFIDEEPKSFLHVAQAGVECSECRSMYEILPRNTAFTRFSDCFHSVSCCGYGRKRFYRFPAFSDGIERVKRAFRLRRAAARSASLSDYSEFLIEKPFKGLTFEQTMDMLGCPSVIGGKTSLLKDADTTVPFDAYNLSLFFDDGICLGAIQWKPSTAGKNLWEPKPAKDFDLTAVFEPPPGSELAGRLLTSTNFSKMASSGKPLRLEEIPVLTKPYHIH